MFPGRGGAATWQQEAMPRVLSLGPRHPTTATADVLAGFLVMFLPLMLAAALGMYRARRRAALWASMEVRLNPRIALKP